MLPMPPHGKVARTAIQIKQGAHLPHWTRDGAIYAVTFRLADSLPRVVLENWLRERRNILKTAEQMGRELSVYEEQRLRELYSERIETYLDTGHGSCWMRDPTVARLVAEALHHFDRERYTLHAWCIMPNHVHTIVSPYEGYKLPALLHSWKSYTAKAANKVLNRTGAFWQEEYYDHLIRDESDYAHAIAYLKENPLKAGIPQWPWVYWMGKNQPNV